MQKTRNGELGGLIIEDDNAIAMIERDYLEFDQFTVEIAPGGLSGIERSAAG
ncbi:MAG: hypothetical protein H6Q73_4411 [Firmicutes bacterium]|nr:hypothetical protein [Bacillota bacterium]